MVRFSLHERLKLQHLGQKLQDKASSSPQAHSFDGGPLPPSVYLGRHWRSRDKIYQAFPLHFCILQALITGRWEGLRTRLPCLMCLRSSNSWPLKPHPPAYSMRIVLRASCLMLEIKEFRCYEAKIEESEKAGSHRESNPGQPLSMYWVAARCVTEAFCTTCAVHIEDCEGWWLSGCRGSVAEHWLLKPEVSWVRLQVAAGLFTFLYFHLITSKFLYADSTLRGFGVLFYVNHLLVTGECTEKHYLWKLILTI